MLRAYRTGDVRAAEAPLLEAGEPLMAHAAAAVAHAVIRELRARKITIPGTSVLLAVGGGNNGGDALYAGSHLAQRGMAVTALLVGSGAHAAGLAAAQRAGVRVVSYSEHPQALTELARATVWIDGLVGIGIHGGLRGAAAEVVTALEEARQARAIDPVVVAVDVPSGVSADDGVVAGPILHADVTVTMGIAKPGIILDPGRRFAGRVEVVPLGLEAHLPSEPALISLIDADVADLWDYPGPDSHKYTRGVVGLMTGSVAYPGAALLSASAALAGGAGMVRFAGPRELASIVVQAHPEVVIAPGRVQCWVLGSGIDMEDSTASAEVARRLQESIADGCPVVVDAGAIALAGETDLPSTVVLTPHPGELSRLLAQRGEPMSREEIAANPAKAVRLAATLTGATVMLKSSVDLVAAPDGPLYVQSGAPAWRATAGAGDVQAGLLGAMLAAWGDELAELGKGRGIPARIAAAAAHLHGHAAALAAGPGVGRPIRATEIAARLPDAIGMALTPAPIETLEAEE
ncbi:MAG: bifunctional ADP-dependent NAD(P)H-hydrate dehydratase/NAD(P)H-hydrate epimerase [Ancrocorticia sp.]|jgi:hydroxyethylthiazole kinase-like uncharacterized protein yjeF|nr:bifunctional ADP-dependent NAD(P)H-hydrate dehydratase/NAD(P)H-hydrate epimerase [Ancrocorticia sp.]MCI1933308.1 bifunctional ADP-dependent NAD(P)H-hydrate dehydratase/NAD(P)H-hydrate epimerase [Ancrocorticia sp.]